MKTLTLLFILLFAIQSASAQLYLTAGVSKNKEGGGNYDSKIYQDIFSSANKDRFKYDFYEFGVVYKNEGLVIGGNLELTYNNISMLAIQKSLSYSGVSQYGSSNSL